MCVLLYILPRIYNRAPYINHLFPVMIDDLITHEWQGKAEPQTSYEMSSITSGNKWFIQCHSSLYVQFMQQQLMIKTPKMGAACVLSEMYAQKWLGEFPFLINVLLKQFLKILELKTHCLKEKELHLRTWIQYIRSWLGNRKGWRKGLWIEYIHSIYKVMIRK